MASLVVGSPSSTSVKIDFRQDASSSEFLPLQPNPNDPVTIIPVEGFGDMLRSVYDTNLNGKVDTVDDVPIDAVEGLQATINDIYNKIGGGGGNEILVVTNSGGDIFLAGTPVCKVGSEYRIAAAVAPYQNCLGLAVAASNPGQQLKIQQTGLMTMTTTAWDLVTDQVGGLPTDVNLYMTTLGKISPDAPTASPYYLVKVGYALNNTDLLIDLDLLLKL